MATSNVVPLPVDATADQAIADLRRWHARAERRPGLRRLAERWRWPVRRVRDLVQAPGRWLDEPALVALRLERAEAELEQVRAEQVDALRFERGVADALRAEVRDLRDRLEILEGTVDSKIDRDEVGVLVEQATLAFVEEHERQLAALVAEVQKLQAVVVDQRETIADLAVHVRRLNAQTAQPALVAPPAKPAAPAPPPKDPEPRNAWEVWWCEQVEPRAIALQWRYGRRDALAWFARTRIGLSREHEVSGEQIRTAVLALLDRAESGHADVSNWKNAIRQYALKQRKFTAQREAEGPSPKQRRFEDLRELWGLYVRRARQPSWLAKAEASGELKLEDAHRAAFKAWGSARKAQETVRDGAGAIDREFWAFRKAYLEVIRSQ